jgi:hypothetical protein
MTDLALAGLRRYFCEMVDLAQYLMGFADDPLSGFRQANLAFRSLKEPDSEFLFELPDLLTQGRLADVQANGRAAEVKFFGHGDQIPQVS